MVQLPVVHWSTHTHTHTLFRLQIEQWGKVYCYSEKSWTTDHHLVLVWGHGVSGRQCRKTEYSNREKTKGLHSCVSGIAIGWVNLTPTLSSPDHQLQEVSRLSTFCPHIPESQSIYFDNPYSLDYSCQTQVLRKSETKKNCLNPDWADFLFTDREVSKVY